MKTDQRLVDCPICGNQWLCDNLNHCRAVVDNHTRRGEPFGKLIGGTMPKTNTKKQAVLDALIDTYKREPINGWKLAMMTRTMRYGAVIFELRRNGINIDTIQKGAGHFEYLLRTSPRKIDKQNFCLA